MSENKLTAESKIPETFIHLHTIFDILDAVAEEDHDNLLGAFEYILANYKITKLTK